MSLNCLNLTIPTIPPSVNGYARHTRRGGHYVTSEALNFKGAVMSHAGTRRVVGTFFKVEIGVFLGKGQRGDVDNFPKLVMDALARAGVFCVPTGKSKLPCPQSDSYVTELHVRKSRAIDGKGYTEITVTAL